MNKENQKKYKEYQKLQAKAKKANGPTLLYREPELAVRVIREEFNAEYRGVVIDDIRSDLGVTVIMVEHDMSLVSEVADRVLCVNLGEVLSTGTAAEVQSDPRVVAAYLGG